MGVVKSTNDHTFDRTGVIDMRFYDRTNRIDAAIKRQQGRIDALIEKGVDRKGQPIAASLANMDAMMALTVQEHTAFQHQQSRAATMGKLNTDEALTAQTALGDHHNPENGGWSNGVNLATKVIITQMVKELLAKSYGSLDFFK
jgi:hypothetical protein